MSTKHVARAPHLVLDAVRHPLHTVAFGIGVVRGAAAAVVRAASGAGGPAHAEWIAPPEPVAEEAAGETVVGSAEEPELRLGDHLTPAEQRAPGEPGEQFATEPSAVSRTSAHGGGAGRRGDAELDEWYDESAEADDLPDNVVDILAEGDQGPLVDRAAMKAAITESESLRRAAEQHPE